MPGGTTGGAATSSTTGSRRNRSDTINTVDTTGTAGTAGTLTDEQKARLLDDMPLDDMHDDPGSSNGSSDSMGHGADPIARRKRRRIGGDDIVVDAGNGGAAASTGSTTLKQSQSASASAPSSAPGANGSLRNDGLDEKEEEEQAGGSKEQQRGQEKQVLVSEAKARMSKWAQRLFDPNRVRGIVETPEIIPLNDEFLTAFGKREKEYDDKVGRANAAADGGGKEDGKDAHEDDDEMEPASAAAAAASASPSADGGGKGCKLRISNLYFGTTEDGIFAAFSRYGALVNVNLITDAGTGKSTGRAYVTYDDAESATMAMEEMDGKRLDGRMLRIGVANDKKSGGAAASRKKRRSLDDDGAPGDILAGDAGGGGGGKGANSSDRYWEKDLSTKCYNCGEVGHMAAACPNETKIPPCPLCGNLGVADGTVPPHDSWSCPLKATCFNCGVPGHINRDCPHGRGLPRRMVCGRCFLSGHHRWQCREHSSRVSQYGAKCMVPTCHRTGHFCCSKMRWFFGLSGQYCFNCGEKGHHGQQCERPVLDVCARNGEIAEREIERATALSLHEEMHEQRRRRGGGDNNHRGRKRDRSNSSDRNGGMRGKSQPPPQKAGRYNEGRRRSGGGGGKGGGGGGWGEERGYKQGGSGRRNSGGGSRGGSRGYRR